MQFCHTFADQIFRFPQFFTDMQQAVAFVHEQLGGAKEFPSFKAGDNVTVNYKIIEGAKERIQSFKGDVIKRQGSGATKSFTVRKISDGIGVERLFPLLSPNIDSIQVNKIGRVRRAKLFYLRSRSGKSARIAEKKRAVDHTKSAKGTKAAAKSQKAATAEA